jgi:hypothetical protein
VPLSALLVARVVAREGPGLMLVELSVVQQRYHAVMEVLGSLMPVTEVAERYGVSRKSVHAWVRRYEAEGLAAPADRIAPAALPAASGVGGDVGCEVGTAVAARDGPGGQ